MGTANPNTQDLWRYDYFKLQFPDNLHELSFKRQRQIEQAVFEFMGDAHPSSYAGPKFTPLAPGPSRPNGLLLVEVWGPAAGAIDRLPLEWIENVTFVHIKTFANMVEGEQYNYLLNLFDVAGFRKATRITPPQRRNSPKWTGLPGLQIGSKKSDIHFGVYVRPGERIGVEARFRDDRLATARDHALVAVDENLKRGREGWSAFRRFLIKQANAELHKEFLSREVEVSDYLTDFSRMSVGMHPVPYIEPQVQRFGIGGLPIVVEPDSAE